VHGRYPHLLAFSADVSAEGNDDKSTIDKGMLGVVSASFAVK
jgi:hypothetical protein